MKQDYKKFLKDTLTLAKKGKGLVSPNPLVGAIVTNGKRVLGRGYHQAFGMPHAEIEALKQAKEKAKGATLYVNLEPCCHYGKTPACTEAIVSSGIKEVICCMKDPNPLVNGKGVTYLEENGIKVRVGWLEREAEKLNEPYITYITKKRPYIVLKWAETLDGKIATSTGDSKWITSEDTRKFVKNLRFEFDGILVGVNTVIQDNPGLNYFSPAFHTKQKLIERKKYVKIILDSNLRTPLNGKLWENPTTKILIFTSEKTKDEKIEPYLKKNCKVLKVQEKQGKLIIEEVIRHLYTIGIGTILVEGGQKILTSFWEEKRCDKIMVFIGNKIIGGENSLSPIAGKNREKFSDSSEIADIKVKQISTDIYIEGKPCFQE